MIARLLLSGLWRLTQGVLIGLFVFVAATWPILIIDLIALFGVQPL